MYTPSSVESSMQNPSNIFLSDVQIAKRYGVTRQTVWRWASSNPNFPSPIKLSPGCSRWKLSEIEIWEAAKEGV